jgi:hypothetical protein
MIAILVVFVGIPVITLVVAFGLIMLIASWTR